MSELTILQISRAELAEMLESIRPVIDPGWKSEALTMKTCAETLGVSTRTLQDLVNADQIPHFHIGKMPRFWLHQLHDWPGTKRIQSVGEKVFADECRVRKSKTK